MALDAFDEATTAVREANERGVPLKLIGGQAVRLLCPLFPHRARTDQDMDFASVSSARRPVMDFFAARGFVGDQRFNTLHGDRQMYFTTADGGVSVGAGTSIGLNAVHAANSHSRASVGPPRAVISLFACDGTRRHAAQ